MPRRTTGAHLYPREKKYISVVQSNAALSAYDPELLHDDGLVRVWRVRTSRLHVYYVSRPSFLPLPFLAWEPGLTWHSLYPGTDKLARLLDEQFHDGLPGKSSSKWTPLMRQLIEAAPRHSSKIPPEALKDLVIEIALASK